MEATSARESSLFGLFRGLTGDIRTLIRQEIQLAKTEMTENVSRASRNAVKLAIGGIIAYAGLIVFLISLGWLLAWLFAMAGLQPILASFFGMAFIGLAVSSFGAALLLLAVKKLSKASIAPQRTLQTLQELKGANHKSAPAAQLQRASKPSSAEIETHVQATENRVGETLDELGRRLSPAHINEQVKRKIEAKPYSAGLIAGLAGLLSGLLLRRAFRRA
jgi:hypothetical protein